MDSIQVNDSNKGGPEGHDDKMAQAGAGVKISHSDDRMGQEQSITQEPEAKSEATSEGAAARPANVPEKFWDAEKGQVNTEALLESYKHLESTRNKPEGKAEDDSEKTEGEPEGETKEQDNAIAKARDVYAEKGELTDEAYADLEKVGITRDMVDTYIAGQQAAVNEIRQAAFANTGGEEGFTKMAAWANENMTSEEIATIDKLLASADKDLVASGAKMLADRYNADADVEPTTTLGGTSNAASGESYSNRTQMMKDMNSPEYKTDENFRKSVARKIANASKAGIDLFG